jgi:adenylylsulfate kinase-like enzyme
MKTKIDTINAALADAIQGEHALGFKFAQTTDAGRVENIRRAAELARLKVDAGLTEN